MNNKWLSDQSRRSFLKKVLVTTSAVAVPALTLTTTDAFAAKATKASVQYQEKPKKNQMCSKCRFFIKPQGQGGQAHCQAVQGAISPQGWCSLFVAAS